MVTIGRGFPPRWFPILPTRYLRRTRRANDAAPPSDHPGSQRMPSRRVRLLRDFGVAVLAGLMFLAAVWLLTRW
jgi:hypothetical protein